MTFPRLRGYPNKPKMDIVWIEWVDPERNWLQRACVELGEDHMIEVVATAKVSQAVEQWKLYKGA